MSFVLAVAGKGGTGKTTLSALIIRHLAARRDGPVLAVDADPNDNLSDALGLHHEGSLASVTDDFFGDKLTIPAGMTKEAYLDLKLNMILGEGANMDLLVMGHPERAGCYCFVNNVLKARLDGLAKNYAYVVIDNGAGLEHLSRKTTGSIDLLLSVADCSQKAIRAAGRIGALSRELQLSVAQLGLVLNRVPAGFMPRSAELDASGMDLLAQVPESSAVYHADIEGEPVFKLPAEDPAVLAVGVLVDQILTRCKGPTCPGPRR